MRCGELGVRRTAHIWSTVTPSPASGLGVRILGEVKPEFAELLRRADAIFIEEFACIWLYEKTSQSPVRMFCP